MTKLHNLDKLDIMDAFGEMIYKTDIWDREVKVDKWEVKPKKVEITCNSDIGYIWDQVCESGEYMDDRYESDNCIYHDYLDNLDLRYIWKHNVPNYDSWSISPKLEHKYRNGTYQTKLHVGDPRTRQIRQNNERG